MSSIKCSKCGMVSFATTEKCKRCGALINAAEGSTDRGRQTTKRPERPDDERAAIRRSALKKIKSGAIATVLFVASLFIIPLTGHQFTLRGSLIIALTPVAWLLAGVIQLVTGTPFEELSERWDNLAWWQRGLIGTFVFVGGLVIVIAVAVLIISIFVW